MLIVTEIPSWCARGGRVLDLGTGTGRNAIFLARQGYEVDAIDSSPGTIAALRDRAVAHRLPIHAEVMDVCAPDLDFSRYQVVLCTFVLHFLTVDRASELLDRACTQAAAGTIHAIAVITTRGEFFEAPSQRCRYYPQPGELADRYRAHRWQVHREWQEQREAIEKRADGTAMSNLVSFVLAGV